jgi:hypothetical protein
MQEASRLHLFVVVFAAEPLLLAVDDNVVVSRLVAAVVLRWLPVAPDAVFDESHLAVVFCQDTLPLKTPRVSVISCCTGRVPPLTRPEILPHPARRAAPYCCRTSLHINS